MPDRDFIYITANDGIEPDGRMFSDCYIADHLRGVGNKTVRSDGWVNAAKATKHKLEISCVLFSQECDAVWEGKQFGAGDCGQRVIGGKAGEEKNQEMKSQGMGFRLCPGLVSVFQMKNRSVRSLVGQSYARRDHFFQLFNDQINIFHDISPFSVCEI